MTKKIEDLIQSSYRDMAPSFQGEEELLANLPTDQARPRRPLGLPIVAVLLVAAVLAIAQFRSSRLGVEATATEGATDRFTPAIVARPNKGVVPKSTDEVHVRLAHGSGIRVIRDGRWTAVSLDELGKHLAAAGSQKRVVLSVDKDAPWQHVQWVMIICSEQHMPKLAFALHQQKGGEFLLDATLPTDRAVADVQKRGTFRVRVVVGNEREAKWGATSVRMPIAHFYECFTERADELATVARWMTSARRNNPQLGAELKATAKTRFETAARLLAEFYQAGFANIEFYGTKMPNAATRKARVLTYPGASPWGEILVFEVAEGDVKNLASAAKIVRRRLEQAGFEPLEIQQTKNGIRVLTPANADRTLVRQLVERRGATLAMHITV